MQTTDGICSRHVWDAIRDRNSAIDRTRRECKTPFTAFQQFRKEAQKPPIHSAGTQTIRYRLSAIRCMLTGVGTVIRLLRPAEIAYTAQAAVLRTPYPKAAAA